MTSQVFGDELGNFISDFDAEKSLAAAKEQIDQMHNEEVGGLLLGLAAPAAKKLGEKAIEFGKENLSKALEAGKKAIKEAKPAAEDADVTADEGRSAQDILEDADPEGDIAGLGETLGEAGAEAGEAATGDIIDGLLAGSAALDATGVGAVVGGVIAAGVGVYSLVTGLKDIFDHPHEDPGPPPSLPVFEPSAVSNLG